MRKKLKLNKKMMTLGLSLLVPVSLAGGIGIFSNRAAAESETFRDYYSEAVDVTNSDFTKGANPYASGELQGWSIIEKENKANGMIIDVKENYSNNHENVYRLAENPGTIGSDNKILMINTRYSADGSGSAKKGYRSNAITLKANSYYKLSVKALTALNGSSSVKGSIYISGLKDQDGKDVNFAFENIENKSWANYYFYLVTGNEEQEVTIDLYLGSKTSSSLGGVVFYDNIVLEQFSQNYFYKNISDLESTNDIINGVKVEKKAKFLLDELTSAGSEIEMPGFNFDFEDVNNTSSTLGESWKKLATGKNVAHGHASIYSVGTGTQPGQFKETTGYTYAGNNFSNGNKKALVMYTSKGQDAYFTVQSNDIEIKAHGLYKFSAYVKISDNAMTNGAFYVKVKENESIHTVLSSDDYTLASGSSSAITSSGSDNFTNNYQKIDFYVKGHELYDTSVNLQFSIGTEETLAQGCVFIDDITLSYVDYEEFSNASNKLELSTISESPAFTNGYFNSVENEEAKLSYPLKASDWTLTQNDNKFAKQEAGVVYLNNRELFNEMYNDIKTWGQIYPGNPSGIDSPNNAFMFYNNNSYQNLKSPSYKLEKNKYYKLSFDMWTQSLDNADNKNASLTVEIVDENGIVLFKQKGFESETLWKNNSFYFHTAENASNNINVIIHFGEEDQRMTGIAYIDNFEVQADISESVFENAENKIDLTDYFMNLDPTNSIGGSITSSNAYTFSIDETFIPTTNTSANGGIMKGDENEYSENYGVEIEDSNILAIRSRLPSKSTLTSKYPLSTEANNYYKLTFDLRTILRSEIKDSDEHKCNSGVSIGLSDFNLIENLISSDEFTTYTIIFKANTEKSPNLKFTLVSDCDDTTGSALLTHLNFTTSSEEEYSRAKDSENFEKTIFISSEIDSTDDDNTEDDNNQESPAQTDNSMWLLIPSIIFGITIIIALVGFGLRKIKIKKTDKIREESYNRKISVDQDMILKQAQKMRDEEVSSLKETKQNLLNQKDEAEQAHKEAVKEARLNSKGKISKDAEREFKTYASKISRIQQKVEILNEQIEFAQSPDHLMEIERRLSDDEIKRQKELRKESTKK
jgi:hypothetical protein